MKVDVFIPNRSVYIYPFDDDEQNCITVMMLEDRHGKESPTINCFSMMTKDISKTRQFGEAVLEACRIAEEMAG